MIRIQSSALQILILGFCISLTVGCSEKPAPKQASLGAPQEQKVVLESPKVTEEPPAEVTPMIQQPSEYNYNPQGRRDPFRSILVTAETAQKVEELPPLQRAEVAEMKLIGIIWGSLGYSAMIQTPDGKGYTIRIGTPIGPNNGVVKRITEKNLTVEEKFTDIFGEKKTREVVIDLHPQKEGSE